MPIEKFDSKKFETEYLATLSDPKWESIRFTSRSFSPKEQDQILSALKKNPNIKSVSLTGCSLDSTFFIKLCLAIASHTAITFLDFSDASLSKDMLQAVADIWVTKRTLNRLGLARTQMDDEGFAAFVAILEASQGARLHLKESAFGLNNLTSNSASSLKELLRLATIDSLDLRALPELAPAVPEIIRTLSGEPIQELILINNQMTDATIVALCDAFKERRPAVRSLRIDNNVMSDQGLAAVIGLINEHLPITNLTLSSCGRQRNALLIEALANAMRESPILTGGDIAWTVPPAPFFEIGRTTFRQNKARQAAQQNGAVTAIFPAPAPQNGVHANGNGAYKQNGKPPCAAPLAQSAPA